MLGLNYRVVGLHIFASFELSCTWFKFVLGVVYHRCIGLGPWAYVIWGAHDCTAFIAYGSGAPKVVPLFPRKAREVQKLDEHC